VRSNFEHIVSSYIAGLQALRDALVTLIRITVDDATANELDIIGKLVGEPRDGDVDADYRRRVKARIATNRSSGTPRQLTTIARLLLGDSYSQANGGLVRYENTGTAGYTLTIDGLAVPTALADVLSRFLNQATPGGIASVLVTNGAVPTTWCRFDAAHKFDDARTFFTARRSPRS
jgi:hypothetical protein